MKVVSCKIEPLLGWQRRIRLSARSNRRSSRVGVELPQRAGASVESEDAGCSDVGAISGVGAIGAELEARASGGVRCSPQCPPVHSAVDFSRGC